MIEKRQELVDIFQTLKTTNNALFNILGNQVWLVSLEHPDQYWLTDSACISLGFDPFELADFGGKNPDFFYENDLNDFLEGFKQPNGNKKTSHSKKIRVIHKNGKTVYWQCTGFIVENQKGDSNNLMVVFDDITDKMENEVRNRFEIKKVKDILFRQGDLVLVIDKNFYITEYHQNRDKELLFTPSDFFEGRHLSEIGFSDADLREFILAINESKSEEKTSGFEFSLDLNGTKENYVASISSVNDEGGQLQEIFCIARNQTETKIEEKRLQELALVGEKTTDLTIITDPYCKITWVNQSFEEHTGYKLKEVYGKYPSEFLRGPETDEKTVSLVDKAIKNKKSIQGSIINYTKSGTKYWVDFRIDPVFDEVGMCTHFISIERDVTKRKADEYELMVTREHLLETNRVGRVGGWSYDVALDKVYWTDVTKEIHEVQPDFEPTIKKVIQFYKEGQSRDTYFEVGMSALKTGKSYDVELQVVTAKGNEIWVRAKGKTEFKDGVCKRLYGTFQDIDSFKKIEKKLKDSSLFIKNIADHVPGCVYLYQMFDDGSSKLPFVSEGIYNISGVKAEEVISRPSLIFEMIHPEDVTNVQNLTYQSYQELKKWECSYRIVTTSSDEKWVRGMSSPVRFENGVSWFGFLQEIEAPKSI